MQFAEGESMPTAANDRPDSLTEAARRATLEETLDSLAVEAAITNAISQRARNLGRIALLPEDVAMMRLMRRITMGPAALDSRSEVARLTALEAMVERGAR